MLHTVRIFLTAAGVFAATFMSAQTVTHTISEVQGELFASPLIEQVVTVTGIVTATTNEYSYFIQDGTGAWNGVYIYDNTNLPAIGDLIIIEGEVSEYYDLTEISNITYYEIVSSGNDLPAAVDLGTGFIGESGEPYEGCLVRIVNAVCTTPDAEFGQGYFNDSSGDCMVDDMLYAPDPAWVQDEYYTITGVLTYSYEEYKIEPSDATDVSIGMAIGTIELADINIYPNPTVDAINFTLDYDVIAHVYDLSGRKVFSKTLQNGTTSLDVSGLHFGVYTIDFVNDHSIARASFVKK